jgi:hypothetical protein
MATGIRGQDAGGSVELDGTVYWTFGDTLLASGSMIPNVLGRSNDFDARDCVDLTPKQDGGSAIPLLPKVAGELTVWPVALDAASSSEIGFHYVSVVPDPETGWRPAGVGIGSLNPKTLAAKREVGGALVWPASGPQPASSFADGGYIHVVLNAHQPGTTMQTIRDGYPWFSDIVLARVPTAAQSSPAAYEYWQPAEGGQAGRWISGLWNSATQSWGSALGSVAPLWRQQGGENSVEFAYNEFLRRWVAAYTSDSFTKLKLRAAEAITGPWNDAEAMAVDCSRHRAPPREGFMCYSGAQHSFFARDGGRTLFVTYSNSDTYQVYLHEVHLAAPIVEWTNAAGRALYLPQPAGSSPPAGLNRSGTSFYVSDIPVAGLSPIYRWLHQSTGDVRYASASPGITYANVGAEFYAPTTASAASAANVPLEPVYRWQRDGLSRYSALDLAPSGYVRQELAFYAGCPDSDGDELSDCAESYLGTDSNAGDSEGDGLDDGFEHETVGCNPLVWNADDQDGFSLADELRTGTNPCVWDSGYIGCGIAEYRHPECDVDSDGDGCHDAWETGPDPTLGGRRNPLDFWDVFDPNASGATDVDDVFSVGRRFGTTGSATSIADARKPGLAFGYHAASDRGGVVGSEPWNLAPANGSISLDEVFWVVRQYGHSCGFRTIH